VPAATPTVASPLTDQDLRDLNRAQYIVNVALPFLDKMEAAGRDVTDLRLRRDDIANLIGKLKAAFYPSSQ
jgi:hypothetical protein